MLRIVNHWSQSDRSFQYEEKLILCHLIIELFDGIGSDEFFSFVNEFQLKKESNEWDLVWKEQYEETDKLVFFILENNVDAVVSHKWSFVFSSMKINGNRDETFVCFFALNVSSSSTNAMSQCLFYEFFNKVKRKSKAEKWSKHGPSMSTNWSYPLRTKSHLDFVFVNWMMRPWRKWKLDIYDQHTEFI